jgi:hypothetical protein
MPFAQLLQAGPGPRGPGGPGGGPGAGGPPDEFFIVLIVVVVVALAVGIAIAVLFLLTLSRALQQCRPRNRTMEPGQVWLNLIPCFSLVWMFITVNRIAESLDNEFYDRRLRGDGDFGKTIGTIYCVCNVLGFVPYVNSITGIVGLVCFIIYWVKIAGYSRQLREEEGGTLEDRDDYDDRDDRRGRRKRYDDEDDYDDRPRQRKRSDDDDYDDDRPSRRRRRDDDDDVL